MDRIEGGVSGSSNAARKRDLRRRARALSAPKEPAALERLLENLLSLPELVRAGEVALYAALPGEVPTEELRRVLARRGVRVLLPRVAGEQLALHAIDGEGSLRDGYRGIREPTSAAPTVCAREVDAFVVPGLLFDRQGHRLGRGGADYDRLLARARDDAGRIGLCYAERVVAALPFDPWDVCMDAVVTEEEVIRPDLRGRLE